MIRVRLRVEARAPRVGKSAAALAGCAITATLLAAFPAAAAEPAASGSLIPPLLESAGRGLIPPGMPALLAPESNRSASEPDPPGSGGPTSSDPAQGAGAPPSPAPSSAPSAEQGTPPPSATAGGVRYTPNQVLYEQARGLIEERKFAKARDILKEIGLREPVAPSLDPLVKLATADAHFFDSGIENLIEAQSRYAQFVSFYPLHDLAGYAQFQMGICYLKQSPGSSLDQTYSRKAIEEFDKVRILSPSSRYVEAAEEMKQRALVKLARHDYEVGLFYYKRKAWQGAISRFRGILEEFPRYEPADGVCYYLGLALLRSGNEEEGRIYLEKLTRDYPGSPFAEDAKKHLNQPPSAPEKTATKD